jgi:hypothetical protein
MPPVGYSAQIAAGARPCCTPSRGRQRPFLISSANRSKGRSKCALPL